MESTIYRIRVGEKKTLSLPAGRNRVKQERALVLRRHEVFAVHLCEGTSEENR